jgi:hypothetical protein
VANFDRGGSQRVNPEGQKKTYASMTSVTLTGSGAQVDCLGLIQTGSGSFLPKMNLTRASVSLSMYSGAAGPAGISVLLAIRNTLTSSGMSGTFSQLATAVAILDQNDPSAQGFPVLYNNYSGAVLGGLQGFVRSQEVTVGSNASGNLSPSLGVDWKFPDGGGKQPSITKSGTQFSLEIVIPVVGPVGALLSGMALAGGWEWTEELNT